MTRSLAGSRPVVFDIKGHKARAEVGFFDRPGHRRAIVNQIAFHAVDDLDLLALALEVVLAEAASGKTGRRHGR